jgi:hypothetical protein
MKTSPLIKPIVCCALAGFLLSCASVPRHPNLAVAQQLAEQAIDKITEAQKANNYDMKGHAARAKALLEQAVEEIKLAEQVANANQ